MREARVSSERSDFEGPSSLFGYSESECQELVHVIRLGREVTLPLIDPGRISEVKWRKPLGDGAYCTTYEAELLLREEEEEEERDECERSSGGSRWRRRRQKKTVALRIVKAERRSEVLKEFKMIVSIPRAAVEVYGVTYVAESMLASGGEERGSKPPTFFVCMVLEFCPYGSMDDFFRCHNNSIPLATRVDVLLGALGGLKQLKANSIIWRDMKGQNMLVRRYEEETERNFGDGSAIEGEGGRKGCQIGGRSRERCSRWSGDEDKILMDNHKELRSKWSDYMTLLPGRTSQAIKIRWRRLRLMRSNEAAADTKKNRLRLVQVSPVLPFGLDAFLIFFF